MSKSARQPSAPYSDSRRRHVQEAAEDCGPPRRRHSTVPPPRTDTLVTTADGDRPPGSNSSSTVVSAVCDYVYVLERGHLVEEGAPEAVFTAPKHPYTRRLLASVPSIGP